MSFSSSSCSPQQVLSGMEELMSHILVELLTIRREQRARAAAAAAAQQKEREREQERQRVLQQQAQAQAQQQGSDGLESAAAGSPSRRSSSSQRAPRPRLPRAKEQVVVQYLPPDKNTEMTQEGIKISANMVQHREEQQAAAAAAAAASVKEEKKEPEQLAAASRWSVTPPAPKSRKRRGQNNSGQSQKHAKVEAGLSQEGGSPNSQQASQSMSQEESSCKREEASQSQEDSLAAESAAGVAGSQPKSRQLVYPRNEKQFASLVINMSACYLHVQNRSHANIRERFYHDKHLFGKQSNCDRSLSLLCAILGVSRWDLNLVATSKAMIMGSLQYEIEDFEEEGEEEGKGQQGSEGERALSQSAAAAAPSSSSSAPRPPRLTLVDCQQGTSLTPYVNRIRGMACSASWLLLVEKDTVWSKIAQTGFPQMHNCLLVTDKGMPSMSIRNFLHLLHSKFPSLPMWGLFDADPAGLTIFKAYKYGSKQSAAQTQPLPDLQLLGLSLHDLQDKGVLQSAALKLTDKDHTSIQNMLNSEIGQKDAAIRHELQALLSFNCKAELEALSKLGDTYLTQHYITGKKEQLLNKMQQQQQAAEREQTAATVSPAAASSAVSPFSSSPSLGLVELEGESSWISAEAEESWFD